MKKRKRLKTPTKPPGDHEAKVVLKDQPDDMFGKNYMNTLSLEILCHILGYLPFKDVMKMDHKSKHLHEAVTLHLRVRKKIDLTENDIYGWMSEKITDKVLTKLLSRCRDLEYIQGFHVPCLAKRRTRGLDTLSVPGIIEALALCTNLKGIEISDIFLLEAILAYIPGVEILGTFKNRVGSFPVDEMNRLKLSENPRITSLHLIGIVVPELPPLMYLKHLQLRWVHLSGPHPFVNFAAPQLQTLVMAHCGGPANSNPLKYVPLITSLATAHNLKRLELIRVPILGGLIQHVVEDSWRIEGFKKINHLKFGACKFTLEMDVGYLVITAAPNLEELCLQPSLTKDSLFIALRLADVSFRSLQTLYLGFVDSFPEPGQWTNEDLAAEHLSEVVEHPAMVTDMGMKSVGQCFPELKHVHIYNCPHIHTPTKWLLSGGQSWSQLRELYLRRCHAIRLADFCHFIEQLPSLDLLHLEQMFREPPKGCSRVGLSAGTGLGMSSALVAHQGPNISDILDVEGSDDSENENDNNNNNELINQEAGEMSGDQRDLQSEETDSKSTNQEQQEQSAVCNTSDISNPEDKTIEVVESAVACSKTRSSKVQSICETNTSHSLNQQEKGSNENQLNVKTEPIYLDSQAHGNSTQESQMNSLGIVNSSVSLLTNCIPLQNETTKASSDSVSFSGQNVSQDENTDQRIPFTVHNSLLSPGMALVNQRSEYNTPEVSHDQIFVPSQPETDLQDFSPNSEKKSIGFKRPPQIEEKIDKAVSEMKTENEIEYENDKMTTEYEYNDVEEEEEEDEFLLHGVELADEDTDSDEEPSSQEPASVNPERGDKKEMAFIRNEDLKDDIWEMEQNQMKRNNKIVTTDDRNMEVSQSKSEEKRHSYSKETGLGYTERQNTPRLLPNITEKVDNPDLGVKEESIDHISQESAIKQTNNGCEVMENNMDTSDTSCKETSGGKVSSQVNKNPTEMDTTLIHENSESVKYEIKSEIKPEQHSCLSYTASALCTEDREVDTVKQNKDTGRHHNLEDFITCESNTKPVLESESKYTRKMDVSEDNDIEEENDEDNNCESETETVLIVRREEPRGYKVTSEKVSKSEKVIQENNITLAGEVTVRSLSGEINIKPSQGQMLGIVSNVVIMLGMTMHRPKASGTRQLGRDIVVTIGSQSTYIGSGEIDVSIVNGKKIISILQTEGPVAPCETLSDVLCSCGNPSILDEIPVKDSDCNMEQTVSDNIKNSCEGVDSKDITRCQSKECKCPTDDSERDDQGRGVQDQVRNIGNVSVDENIGNHNVVQSENEMVSHMSVNDNIKDRKEGNVGHKEDKMSPNDAGEVKGMIICDNQERGILHTCTGMVVLLSPCCQMYGNMRIRDADPSSTIAPSSLGTFWSCTVDDTAQASTAVQPVVISKADTTIQRRKSNDKACQTRATSAQSDPSNQGISQASVRVSAGHRDVEVSRVNHPVSGTDSYMVREGKRMVDQSTSTSDPVVEEDHIQILDIKSKSLTCLTLHIVGITDLVLTECPKLNRVTASACRVLKNVKIKSADKLQKTSFAQCKKLNEENLLKEIASQDDLKNRIVHLRPLHQFDRGSLEEGLFGKPDVEYNFCVIYDYSPVPQETLYNKARVANWPILFSGINLELLQSYNFRESDCVITPKYPWNRRIYTMAGKNENGSHWELITDIPWLRPLAECSSLSEDKLNAMDKKIGVYCPAAKGHFGVTECLADLQNEIAENQAEGMGLVAFAVIVYINMCDVSGTPVPDPYI